MIRSAGPALGLALLLLVVVACAPSSETAALTAVGAAPATAALAEPSPGPPTLIPTPAPPAPTPGPLVAWDVALDGAVLVVDQGGVVYDLAPEDLAVRAWSEPLFRSTAGETALAVGQDLVFVAGDPPRETVVLARDGLGELARLPGWGPLALDGSRRLLMVPRGLEELYPGYNHEIWAYDLSNLDKPPLIVRDAGLSLDDLVVDAPNRRLYVLTSNIMASPPHRGQAWRAYDLDSLEVVAGYPWERGSLTLPAVHPRSGELLGSRVGLNGSRRFLILDPAGNEVRQFATVDGQPLVDPSGQWIYVLRPVGLWVLAYDDLAVRAVLPFDVPPRGLVLSPDGRWLYLVGNGWREARPASQVRAEGYTGVSPFPTSWFGETSLPDRLQARAFPSPSMQDDGTAFVQAVNGLGEPQATYVTGDRGRTWRLLASLARPERAGTDLLGLSPDYWFDHTLTAFGPEGVLLSTDGGATWQPWTPRFAFVSERDGNREIYTVDASGRDVLRVTDSPAAEENPAWSPAWTRLAYQSNRSGNWDIWSQRADCHDEASCDLRQLTDSSGDDLLPSWSPDGQSIAFVSTRDGNPEIYVMDNLGRNLRRLTFDPGGDWRPAWLPDSRHLLFVSGRSGNNDIYQVAVPAVEEARLTAEGEIVPVVVNPADDRDPATRRAGAFLFLSDRGSQMSTYLARVGDPTALSLPFGAPERAEGHPAGLPTDPFTIRAILITALDGDDSNLFLRSYSGYTPLAASPAFDGQPAAEAAPWEPDPAASLAWLAGLSR